ncbi:uncharacterized protein LOC111705694 isoform X2 [Eurytemora carolleeae]|nr:uncharacterized protein LOC111705694 isoform X2 [Eurytemora carolleeae]XP_023334096.1 uncharacterized protein LOC111705694 isoform X2 [Eurytemora carolleeae]XP_023334097.1 uncharacterized protein LOC111705694 isoform X2 [Eurytemora carolleeae]|eukprot:XP_023334095.1 uncharacterized protein LOC111705694 isoform X2 [Eurytemora affinis]
MNASFLLTAVMLLFFSYNKTCTSSFFQSRFFVPHNKLYTPWGENLTGTPWAEYPRPTLVRTDWMNLNGPWDISITDFENLPSFTDSILVPFCVESILGGLEKVATYENNIWYRKILKIPISWKERVLVHFEAVDHETYVFINNQFIGSHKGGYDRFSFDITEFLNRKEDILVLKIYDPTHVHPIPQGKQMQSDHVPGEIFYTPVSGVWKTVWLEPVPATSITGLKITPDVDNSLVSVQVSLSGNTQSEVTVIVIENGTSVAESRFNQTSNYNGTIKIPNPKLWNPQNPFLYDLNVTLASGDSVSSYFGLRKIELRTVGNFKRFFLNNQELGFQLGPLDQGYWPDGLYTPPSFEAMKWDLIATKQLGYNMIRKHIKVEPELWYYLTDKLGLLVWQDFPSILSSKVLADKEAQANFLVEIKSWVNQMFNHPSIILWVVFNEAWGQHNTEDVTAYAKSLDSTRIITDASGWVDHKVGDVLDIHCYPGPICGSPIKPDPERALVLGEFWGRKRVIPGHNWFLETGDGLNEEDFLVRYESAIDILIELEQLGYSAAVITQTTDVEGELNGFFTYDRKVAKAPVSEIKTLTNLILKPDNNKKRNVKIKQQIDEQSPKKSLFYKFLRKISKIVHP